MRVGEQAGIDYHFVEAPIFEQMMAAGQFAEWAEVHGNLYGTALETLEQATGQGQDVLLDIDYQGAAQLKKTWQQGVFIFILPPNKVELERRLRQRGTDTDEVIERRLMVAQNEISQAVWYDYLVINDDFSTALTNLKAIILAERCRSRRSAWILPQIITAKGVQ